VCINNRINIDQFSGHLSCVPENFARILEYV
jgi:hypothetical protein